MKIELKGREVVTTFFSGTTYIGGVTGRDYYSNDEIIDKYGAEFLLSYYKWTIEDSGEKELGPRLDYFDINGTHIKRYLLEKL